MVETNYRFCEANELIIARTRLLIDKGGVEAGMGIALYE